MYAQWGIWTWTYIHIMEERERERRGYRGHGGKEREKGNRWFVIFLFQLYRRLNWDHAAALVEGWIPRKYANNYHLIF